MRLWLFGGIVFTGTANVRDGNWHHVAITRDSAGLMKMWVDGAVDASVTNQNTFTSNANQYNQNGLLDDMVIGNSKAFNGRQVPGYIDDVRITTGVARDIAADWTAGVYNSALPQGPAVAASTNVPTTGVLSLAEDYQSKL